MHWTTLLFLGITAAACLGYVLRVRRVEVSTRGRLDESASSGLTEPRSLHPVIDEAQCIGCGACVEACPEGRILGMIDGKAELVEPTRCIGHGACKASCPEDAIALVFGTSTRGVDIPYVTPDFETNVPGIFIAGELGGMGLIRNAVEQGRQALDSIRKRAGTSSDDGHDVVIVGAGPAGISASLAALEHRLDAVTVEQDSLGGTVAHYPRGKVVMTQPAVLPIVGMMKFRETTKERLLEFWQRVEAETGLGVRYGERVTGIERSNGGFVVQTTCGTYPTRNVLLALGRRGTPRRLEVPGEDLPKVVYRLSDPAQYRGRRVLVVGGGDSALEAACAIAEEPGTTVTLSYRSAAFSRAKPKNRERLETLARKKRLNVVMESRVRSIAADHVELEHGSSTRRLDNDAVIVAVGGILPTPFLESIGVEVETKYGTA